MKHVYKNVHMNNLIDVRKIVTFMCQLLQTVPKEQQFTLAVSDHKSSRHHPAPSGTIRPGRTGLWPRLLRTWPAHLHSGPLEMGTESDRIGQTARHFPDFELGFNMV